MAQAHRLASGNGFTESCSLLAATFLRCDAGVVWVSYPGGPTSGVECEVLSDVDLDALRGGANEGRRVLVAVPADGSPPVLLGFVNKQVGAAAPVAPASLPESTEIVVDGERLVLEARRELVLRCGPSEIILRRDGKVIVRGRDVTTRAAATNRVKGANVKIN